MDAQPKALRPYLLVTSAFVLFGAVAGFAVFLQQRGPPLADPSPAGADLDAVATRPMSPPSMLDAATATRARAWAEDAIFSPDGSARRAAADQLIALGAQAVPFLLDGVHRLATEPGGFASMEARMRLRASDGVLRRLRAMLTPTSPPDPAPIDPGERWSERRAKSWFVWWDAYAASRPELR